MSQYGVENDCDCLFYTTANNEYVIFTIVIIPSPYSVSHFAMFPARTLLQRDKEIEKGKILLGKYKSLSAAENTWRTFFFLIKGIAQQYII